MDKSLVVAFLLLTTHSWSATAECGNCSSASPTRIQCISEYQYYDCFESEPRLYTCPIGFCTANSANGDPCSVAKTATTCSTCGVCNRFTQIACTAISSYRRCDSSGALIGAELGCPAGTYCSLLSNDFTKPCVPFTGQEILCYRNGLRDFCAGKANGNYEDPESSAEQCNSFIVCVDGVGEKQTCVAPRVFSPIYKICVSPVLHTCS